MKINELMLQPYSRGYERIPVVSFRRVFRPQSPQGFRCRQKFESLHCSRSPLSSRRDCPVAGRRCPLRGRTIFCGCCLRQPTTDCINTLSPGRNVPRGLKPRHMCVFRGTAKTVPFQSRIHATGSGADCSKSNTRPPESVIRAAHDGHATARRCFVFNALGQHRFGALLATILGDGYRSARH